MIVCARALRVDDIVGLVDRFLACDAVVGVESADRSTRWTTLDRLLGWFGVGRHHVEPRRLDSVANAVRYFD